MGLIDDNLRDERARRQEITGEVADMMRERGISFNPHIPDPEEAARIEEILRAQQIKDFCDYRNLAKLVKLVSNLTQYTYLEEGLVSVLTLLSDERANQVLRHLHITERTAPAQECSEAFLEAMQAVEPYTKSVQLTWTPPANGNPERIVVTVVYDPPLS